MEQRISLVTLGVADLKRSLAFYEQLGWRGQEVQGTVFFQAGGQAVVLWSRGNLWLPIAESPTTATLASVGSHSRTTSAPVRK